ncbi:carboxypeptidase-like regulatory domain-containing protein [Prevotella sp. HUN102]|uniref:carboxypeptidase-like regulatory domain-containing protein n=1 Tax=Prevotella sp. HUN102 TaxID=1392486 RepID=UPI000490E627|nr:carboxypeptidase-like regulatory domain-containing protein [Prevotella sp. HUN102]
MIKEIRMFTAVLFLCLAQTVLAQITITGTVTDKGGSPIPSAIVKSVDATTKKTTAYCSTNLDGKFSIKTKVGNELQITAMSYRKWQMPVKENMAEQHLVLEEDPKALDEVIVKAAPVKLNGDTIKYLLGAYAKPGDRTLADVLARIPGVEVDKSGVISYEGRSISNFYIEGMDMLGGKYGAATKTLPQGDVATVEVMKHHQPIRVLDDFIYSDESAINIRMKKGAKAHWIASFNSGGGYKSKGALWSFETFAMRLKQNWQTIITYKTNNTGKNIVTETSDIFSFNDLNSKLNQLISLPLPANSSLERRSLFNRSHALSLNMLQRINESSQVNFQITYTNDRQEGNSQRTAEYFTNRGNRTTDNHKHYTAKTNELFAKIKYENNANRQYLKNELSTNLNWNRQLLTERGTHPHDMNGNLPVFTLKDNLTVMRKYGNRLFSLESRNIMEVRPHQLAVDSLRQDINQHYYETDTRISGSFRLGKLILTGKIGANAARYQFSSRLSGVSDSIGTLAGRSRFSMLRLYASPNMEYKWADFIFTLSSEISYNQYKYSLDRRKSRTLFSPNLHIRWNATPRFTFSFNGNIGQSEVDPNQFYPTLVLEDYEYIHKGLADYRIGRDKSADFILRYNNALQGTSLLLSLNRTINTTPYTTSQHYAGDYIILGLVPQETKNNLWSVRFVGAQGIGFLKGKLNVRAIYNRLKSNLIQNDEPMPFNTKTLNLSAGLTIGLIPRVDCGYNLHYTFHQSAMPSLATTSNINNWKHEGYVRFPILRQLTAEAKAEYYHNQMANNLFKDIFFADFSIRYAFNKFDVTLELNNILNKKNYGYGINGTLIHSYSNLEIRGREIMLTLYYKP